MSFSEIYFVRDSLKAGESRTSLSFLFVSFQSSFFRRHKPMNTYLYCVVHLKHLQTLPVIERLFIDLVKITSISMHQLYDLLLIIIFKICPVYKYNRYLKYYNIC
jgi:hypothetical protein